MLRLEDEIVDFIRGLLEHRFDCVVAIERKGLELFTCAQRMLVETHLPWPQIVAAGPARRMAHHLFREKRVLVFDDSIVHGRMLRWVTSELRKAAEEVYSAAFIVSEECPRPWRPDFFHAVYDLDVYPSKRRELVTFLRERSYPLVSNQFLFSFRSTPYERSEFVKALECLGTVYSVPPMTATKQPEMLTLFAPSFRDAIQDGFPPDAYLEEICKLRFQVEENGTVVCAPEASPIVPFDFTYPVDAWMDGAWCSPISLLMEEVDESSSSTEWFECLALYSNLVLAQEFVRAFHETGFAMGRKTEFLGVTRDALRYFYPLSWRAVEVVAEKRLRACFGGNRQYALPVDLLPSNSKSCLMVESEEDALKAAHRAIRVAVEIFDGWREIQARKGGMEHWIDRDGLTFDQLRKRLGEWIDDAQTSQALDVLLDQSIVIPLHSVSSSLESVRHRRMLARLYRPAGEYVLQQLEGVSVARRSIRPPSEEQIGGNHAYRGPRGPDEEVQL